MGRPENDDYLLISHIQISNKIFKILYLNIGLTITLIELTTKVFILKPTENTNIIITNFEMFSGNHFRVSNNIRF